MRNRHHLIFTSLRIAVLVTGLVLFPLTQRVQGHDGPPYAVMVDKLVGPCSISLWADPDIGTGTFFIVLEPIANGTIPDDVKLSLTVQPVSGRLAEVSYPAHREALSGQVQYKSEVQFDSQERWRVRVKLESAKGNGEISTEVEPTPPGPGRWSILLYLFPFLALAALWIRAMIYRRRRRTAN